MHVQLHLALVLAIHAELLVLDEPTLGLDVIYRQRFYDALLNDYFNEGRSILVTTHEVREIEHILTDVVFVNHGKQCLSMEMDKIGDEFSKVCVAPAARDRAREFAPLSERPSLHGVEYVYRGLPREELGILGEVTTPNLAEIFVAVAGDQK
jgi:ABC-2 type transport system ATP-binding protein